MLTRHGTWTQLELRLPECAYQPLGFAAGDTNLYRYVGDDPTNCVDPSGLAPPLPVAPAPHPAPLPYEFPVYDTFPINPNPRMPSYPVRQPDGSVKEIFDPDYYLYQNPGPVPLAPAPHPAPPSGPFLAPEPHPVPVSVLRINDFGTDPSDKVGGHFGADFVIVDRITVAIEEIKTGSYIARASIGNSFIYAQVNKSQTWLTRGAKALAKADKIDAGTDKLDRLIAHENLHLRIANRIAQVATANLNQGVRAQITGNDNSAKDTASDTAKANLLKLVEQVRANAEAAAAVLQKVYDDETLHGDKFNDQLVWKDDWQERVDNYLSMHYKWTIPKS